MTTFSATRFANSIKNVTINVRLDYQAINQCLKTIIENLSKKTSEEDRKKLQDAVLLLKASEKKNNFVSSYLRFLTYMKSMITWQMIARL